MAKLPWMRKEFVSRLLQEAISDDKEEEATRIKGILRNESQKKIWATIAASSSNLEPPAPPG